MNKMRCGALALTLACLALGCQEEPAGPQNLGQLEEDAGPDADMTPEQDSGEQDSGEQDSGEQDMAADAETPDPDPEVIQIRYLPQGEGFYDLPWPSDGRLLEGGGLDMSGFNASNPIMARFVDALQTQVQGFATMPVVYMELESALEEASLPSPQDTRDVQSPLQLLDLSQEGCGTRLPLDSSLRSQEDPFTGERTLLQAKNAIGTVLRPGTPYGLVVLKTLGGEQGLRAARPEGFQAVWEGDGSALSASLGPLRACLPSLDLDPDQIAVATVWTPQDPVAQMQRLRDAVVDPALQTRPIEGWQRSDAWSRSGLELSTWVGDAPMPIFQEGTPPYDPLGGDLIEVSPGEFTVQRWEAVPMMVAWRSDPALDQGDTGRPILVFIDGTGWSRWSHLRSNWVNLALDAGFVVASFMPQFHGGRGGFHGSPELSTFNLLNPAAGRGNFRQQAAETSFFVRVLREQVTQLEGLPALDTDKIVYGGHSQGALVGSLVAAVEDQFQAYVFNGLSSYLTLTLLFRKDLVDFAMLLRTVFNLDEESLDIFHPVPQIMQAGAEVVDPHNYAQRWRGWPQNPRGNHVLVINGQQDATTTPRGMEHLTLSGQLTPVAPQGWDPDVQGLFQLEDSALPIQGNALSLSGQPLTIATYLHPDEGHFTVYRRALARRLAVSFWTSALEGDPVVTTPLEYQCDDQNDDDGDGLIDCADPDCARERPCEEEHCGDGEDDDGDGLIDCADPACLGNSLCKEEACGDGQDNNFDGLVDCADPDCARLAPCFEADCGNGEDEDGDGLIDCADPDCADNNRCEESDCNDDQDDDRDGLTDCEDPSCRGSLYCPERQCEDGLDNDENGLTDCQEPSCHALGACALEAEADCGDGQDNNGDGRVDCQDPSCAALCSQESCADHQLGQAIGPGLFQGTLEEQDDDYYASNCLRLGEGAGSLDVSLAWTAPATGRYRFSTYGSTADTVLSLHPATCQREQELGCDDDEGGLRSSSLLVDAEEGVELVVVISGYGSEDRGSIILHILPEPSPEP